MIVTIILLPVAAASAASGEATVRVQAKHPVLPVAPGLFQEIEIAVKPDSRENMVEAAANDEYDVQLGVKSAYGVLVIDAAEVRDGKLSIRPGEPLTLRYKWTGAVPTEGPMTETIFVRVPVLDAESEVDFSVGADLVIKEIVLPETVQSGTPSKISVLLHDAWHPEEDVSAMTKAFGIASELRIELLSDEPDGVLSYAIDPVPARFFERRQQNPIEIAYPSGGVAFFKSGFSAMEYELGHTWRSTDGRQPLIVPPAPGRYRIRAFLRANVGGATIREYLSPPFEVRGTQNIDRGLPYLIGTTLEILSGLDAEMAARANGELRKPGQNGQTWIDEAAATLGVHMQNAARPSAIQMLGRYANALTASGFPTKDVNEFIRLFLKGYGDYGVLIISKGGIAGWSAESLHALPGSLVPKEQAHEDDRYLVIPFLLGDDFKLNLRSSGNGPVSLWKIIPQGVNAASYPKGKWQRSITVRTGELTPPLPNKSY